MWFFRNLSSRFSFLNNFSQSILKLETLLYQNIFISFYNFLFICKPKQIQKVVWQLKKHAKQLSLKKLVFIYFLLSLVCSRSVEPEKKKNWSTQRKWPTKKMTAFHNFLNVFLILTFYHSSNKKIQRFYLNKFKYKCKKFLFKPLNLTKDYDTLQQQTRKHLLQPLYL